MISELHLSNICGSTIHLASCQSLPSIPSSGRSKCGILRELNNFLLCKKIVDYHVHGSIFTCLKSCKVGIRSIVTVVRPVNTCGTLERAPPRPREVTWVYAALSDATGKHQCVHQAVPGPSSACIVWPSCGNRPPQPSSLLGRSLVGRDMASPGVEGEASILGRPEKPPSFQDLTQA